MPLKTARGASKYQFRKFNGNYNGKSKSNGRTFAKSTEEVGFNDPMKIVYKKNEIDRMMGFDSYEGGQPREAWLLNVHPTVIESTKGNSTLSAVDFYFIQDDGDTFRCTIPYSPYFYIAAREGKEALVDDYLKKKFVGLIKSTTRIFKEDLQLKNHIVGYQKLYIKLVFDNLNDLQAVRKSLMSAVKANSSQQDAVDAYTNLSSENLNGIIENAFEDPLNHVLDIREYDVPYHSRTLIDLNIRVGQWYTVSYHEGHVQISLLASRIERAEPTIMAFDIETTKLPLKFPDSSFDKIMMISYMIDGQGFLITNREIISQNIEDFHYTPREEFEGPFIIFNEPDEVGLLHRFFKHIRSAKPSVIVTYNGDFFDWPFVDARAAFHGLNLTEETGFFRDAEDEYKSSYCSHMDAFRWVKRDSYLPQGSQGLKAVTVSKLGYNPIELDPELMTPYASEKPQVLAQYSVSDAVATYFLYMKYVHPFIFSLCNIIPLNPDEVLRKGTGTLCETLLTVEACTKNIILPNKHVDASQKFFDGHLLASETYVGGHVESLESGVFRSDLPTNFNMDPKVYEELILQLDKALDFSLTVENNVNVDEIENYEEVRDSILKKLSDLRDRPKRSEKPRIYHLDVASMYPNIMITNRLQPDSVKDESFCATCDLNVPNKTCDRRMVWAWRGEYYPAKKGEYHMIYSALQSERFPGPTPFSPFRSFQELSPSEQAAMVQKRIADYSRKVYHRLYDNTVIERETIICQKENSFYIDTVKSFRDRRYDFKGLQKKWVKQLAAIKEKGGLAEIEEAKKMVVLYDSLQLAHKVILNSFYGYVMRKGSRWYSIEMAGITCLTGATIIQMARQIVERAGRPLELDTDGIWCILPESFPENFEFKKKSGGKVFISYPCVMLNHLVHEKFTNHQYSALKDPEKLVYETTSENSIFFEVDGPYRAMILPASTEEGKNLKKRYAVFNFDGSLAELKGFEVKRRGELKLIKDFQSQIFKVFLKGDSLEECYQEVAYVADTWLEILFTKGSNLTDDELIELISENRSMSKALSEYGSQKSTSITTARRLADFLGDQMTKDKGLACRFIISASPKGRPVAERAVPVAIFFAEESVKRHFLRLWLKDNGLYDVDIRDIIDWDYYLKRLGSVVQKLISIPAALQRISNPVTRFPLPDWLQKRVAVLNSKYQQKKIDSIFSLAPTNPSTINNTKVTDIEDLGSVTHKDKRIVARVTKRKLLQQSGNSEAPVSFEVKPVSFMDGYSNWLKYAKKKWKYQKQVKLRRRHLIGFQSRQFTNVLQSSAEVMFENLWHILQIRETDVPGILHAWVIIRNRLTSIRFIVNRKFFVCFKDETLPNVEIEGCLIEKSNAILPHGSTSDKLFLLEIPEKSYLTEKVSISMIFAHPSVSGIYETRIEPIERLILEMGSRKRFNNSVPGALGKGFEFGFESKMFTDPSDNDVSYLDGVEMNYLYAFHFSISNRFVFSLFMPHLKKVEAIIYDKLPGSDMSFPSISKIYEELRSKFDNLIKESSIEYPDTLSCNVIFSGNERKAYKLIDEKLLQYFSTKTKNSLLIIESSLPHILKANVKQIEELPYIMIPRLESNIQSLSWKQHIATKMIQHFLAIGSWLFHRIQLSRFSDIPLCNFESDDIQYSIDVVYSRKLKEHNIILWWNKGPTPDLGGIEKDSILQIASPKDPLEVNNPGAYSNACVDISLSNLALCSILNSALINDIEGIGDMAALNDNYMTAINDDLEEKLGIHDNIGLTHSLPVLKALVKTWWNEAASGNNLADLIIQHLARWISSSKSYLYSPLLSSHVEVIMRKTFLQLLSEIKRLGAHIIHASANKILIKTSKLIVQNAVTYSNYLLKSIKTLPLFHFLDLNVTEYWDYLLWMDSVNYGGKMVAANFSATNEEPQTVVSWHIKSHLPPIIQPEFQSWIVEFIEEVYKQKLEKSNTKVGFVRVKNNNADEDSEIVGSGILKSKLIHPLKRKVAQVRRCFQELQLDENTREDLKFPKLPGSFLNYTDGALELVKSICAVFELSHDLNLEVRFLKKSLLSLLQIQEFSTQAVFRYPSRRLSLDQIPCKQCGVHQDFDLCLHEHLWPTRDDMGTLVFSDGWSCSSCNLVYDRWVFEETLVDNLYHQLTLYQLQDLICSKCKTVKQWSLKERCSCSGEWVLQLSPTKFREMLNVYQSVADFYEFSILQNSVQSILSVLN
ncbi:DNA polymerase epsilon catalytic subunit Pol2 [Schizosaccharomyces pombe]|uniref:DNA polymerase epsilon catalytic subunit A n=1 Tax=Schizosaccharomyces pombe (strain 972 / ATCC 24843) TaxID=284812 RepID=DPOE_SCHPO|nr:DNA polymerase epsilon catalytic subunit Pol2 [Schizosaccharomyces pombe]P87154.1 RecName: Full=DNA polymerase epsilon catalytic subunit A; AltName: Full=DNA polymerase II subunit A [Schizosaccharomyces pombe 972h-]CAB08772.1 DNA polymerase epsilon catalytic subunit Pol2 [Schizosaccharomyces pombe]|eukprot:NP_596354.1 DNA polymerase epsilon catalytic subunit Pol2 [Schizosaccharomyces pombe]